MYHSTFSYSLAFYTLLFYGCSSIRILCSFVLHPSIVYRHFFPFCSNAYNIIAADDNLFAGVMCIIQLLLLLLSFDATIHGWHDPFVRVSACFALLHCLYARCYFIHHRQDSLFFCIIIEYLLSLYVALWMWSSTTAVERISNSHLDIGRGWLRMKVKEWSWWL